MKFFFKFLFVFRMAGLSFLTGAGGGEGEVDGGVGTSSGRFSLSLLVGICLGFRISSMESPRDTSLHPLPSELRGSDEI